MRLFVAIDMEPQICERLETIQRHLKRDLNLSSHAVKWVCPEQMHLTLKFLGEVRDDAIRPVCEAMTQTAAKHDGFEIQVRGVGTFGRPARVVWAGIESSSALTRFQAELENEYEIAGFQKEARAFSGHLTLCRVKSGSAGKKLAAAIQPYSDEMFGTVWAGRVVLYESRLSATGPQYSAVCSAPLK